MNTVLPIALVVSALLLFTQSRMVDSVASGPPEVQGGLLSTGEFRACMTPRNLEPAAMGVHVLTI